MIRQYQDELNKLKQELAEQMKGMSGKGGIGGKIIEEKIIKLENKDKLKEMEDKISKEKENIKIRVDGERKELEEKINLAEDEKLKILEKLQEKQAEEMAFLSKALLIAVFLIFLIYFMFHHIYSEINGITINFQSITINIFTTTTPSTNKVQFGVSRTFSI